MLLVLFFIVGCDTVVINVTSKKVYIKENVLKKSLEYLSSILESKWHDGALKQSKRSCNSGLFDVVRIHLDLKK